MKNKPISQLISQMVFMVYNTELTRYRWPLDTRSIPVCFLCHYIGSGFQCPFVHWQLWWSWAIRDVLQCLYHLFRLIFISAQGNDTYPCGRTSWKQNWALKVSLICALNYHIKLLIFKPTVQGVSVSRVFCSTRY